MATPATFFGVDKTVTGVTILETGETAGYGALASLRLGRNLSALRPLVGMVNDLQRGGNAHTDGIRLWMCSRWRRTGKAMW